MLAAIFNHRHAQLNPAWQSLGENLQEHKERDPCLCTGSFSSLLSVCCSLHDRVLWTMRAPPMQENQVCSFWAQSNLWEPLVQMGGDHGCIRLLQEVANPSTVLSGSVVPLLSELRCGLCKGLGCGPHSAERLPEKHGRALCSESSKKRLPLLIHS